MYPSLFALASLLALTACASVPHPDSRLIRPWTKALEREYPQDKPVIADYTKGDYELIDLAAVHATDLNSPTLKLVDELYRIFHFNAVLIESIPYSSGESPAWYLEEMRKGRHDTYIAGGESGLAAIYASDRHLPFFAGEPDHLAIYQALKKKSYSDEDIIAFYFVCQIPQWICAHESADHLLERQAPEFNAHYCKLFGIAKCPDLEQIRAWYRRYAGNDLSVDVSNEMVAPLDHSPFRTQQIAADIGFVRDRFTLEIIYRMLGKYKKIAVVYGASHFLTLRPAFDKAFGEPGFIEAP